MHRGSDMGALGAGYEAPACAGTLNHGCWMCEESRDLALVLQVAGQKPRLIPAPPHSTPPTICLTRLCTQPPTLCKVFLTKYMMSRAYYTSNYVGITAGQLAGREEGKKGAVKGVLGKECSFRNVCAAYRLDQGDAGEPCCPVVRMLDK